MAENKGKIGLARNKMVSVLAGMVHIRMHTYATIAARNVQIQKWQKETMSRLMMVTVLETYTQDHVDSAGKILHWFDPCRKRPSYLQYESNHYCLKKLPHLL